MSGAASSPYISFRCSLPPFIPYRGLDLVLVGYRLGIDWSAIGVRLDQVISITEFRSNINQNIMLSIPRRPSCVWGRERAGSDGMVRKEDRWPKETKKRRRQVCLLRNLLYVAGLAILVHALVVFLVLARGDVVHPILMVEVPADGLLDALFEL